MNTTDVPWQTAVTLVDKPWPCSAECRWIDDPRPFKGTSVSYYRLTIVEPAPSTRRSEPVTTNSVYVGEIVTAPTEMHVEWMTPGETRQMSNKADPGAQYLALDSNTVSVPVPGVIKAKQQGRAYVTAMSRTPEQVLKLWIWEVQVSDQLVGVGHAVLRRGPQSPVPASGRQPGQSPRAAAEPALSEVEGPRGDPAGNAFVATKPLASSFAHFLERSEESPASGIRRDPFGSLRAGSSLRSG